MNSNALYGVYGISDTTMTAVGVGNSIWRLSGTAWPAMTPPAGTGFPTLRGIHGTSGTQMYTVGDNGTVWFYNGTAWRIEVFPNQTQLNGVFVFSAAEVYVIGQGGIIYHKNPKITVRFDAVREPAFVRCLGQSIGR